MKKKVIGFLHTHWDREWYREFEIFRLRLLRVFDNILSLLESNTIPSFYFDGQTSALQDYLELRPEKTDIVKKLIKDKRLYIGPFYCLTDEFLTNNTLADKNLEIGLKYSKEMGCNDFLGYYADTFGHTPNLIPVLKKYGIDTTVVWRGVGDIPSEFTWLDDFGNSINCINLVRGYFNDFFTSDIPIDKRVEYIKNNLDKIAEKSGDVLLMPIGGDHLGINPDIKTILNEVNEKLEDYEIEIGSIFDYINLVKDNFFQYIHKGELRDNSKTFTLQGSFSSRLDLKRWNIETTHLIEKAEYLAEYFKNDKYKTAIKYAYTLLLQNQAHDSIYGCATDDVHREDIIRYKKIQQIANTIIDELRFENDIEDNEIICSKNDYKGVVEFKTTKKYDKYQLLNTEKGFDKKLLTDTLRVPVTEDYADIYTYLGTVHCKKNQQQKIETIIQSDVFTSDKCIGNSNIFLTFENGKLKVGDYEIKFIDYVDLGDSYNEAPDINDKGRVGRITDFKVLYNGIIRSAVELTVNLGDIIKIVVSLDNESEILKFNLNWNNTKTYHVIKVEIDTKKQIEETYSEDINKIIKREFDASYDIRQNLPKSKGIEVKNNTAPMQRGVWTNGVGVITKGLTQYEIYNTIIAIPVMRSTKLLSNPKNPARTTPAGPPLELNDLMMLGDNNAEFMIFLNNKEKLKELISEVYNYVV